MANYTDNRMVCTRDFLEKYLLDNNPWNDGFLSENNISFNKLFECTSIDDYRELTACTPIDYVRKPKYKEIEDDYFEVLFETRWHYPIKAIIKSLEIEKDRIMWYVIEENNIYFSKFYWKDNQIVEDTLFIEDTDEFNEWYYPFWDVVDAAKEYKYPDFWIWGYEPEKRCGWINWPSTDLISRYLNYYPAGEYYEEIRRRK